jgi:replicative DNA helicase
MLDEYAKAESNKGKVYGAMTGINEIDKICRGAKRGELWVHAGFPGELKTSFAANWCYNLVTHFKVNVVYISLEMPYEQVRRNVYTTHTANLRWLMSGKKALDYRKIRDGELDPAEKEFYFNEVIPDFCNNPSYTHFEVVTPEKEWTMDDIRMEVELLHKQFEVGLVVIDHGQWVEARKGKKSKDYVIELNSVVRDAKRFALHFNHREGVPVLLLWQINREGKEDANKNDGVYKAKALTYANEVEKTADVITATYLNDELRKSGATKFCNLKNRDNPLFEPFLAHVNFASRRIANMDRYSNNVTMAAEEHESVFNGMAFSEV